VPGPTSYKVEESLEKSAKMKQAYRPIFSKAKKVTYVSKYKNIVDDQLI